MRLNRIEILENLETMMLRLGIGEFTDRFAAYVLLEKLVASNYTMKPMSENELTILFKEAYKYAPRKILDIYMDFVSTLPTDVEISIAKKEDELYFETGSESISIMI